MLLQLNSIKPYMPPIGVFNELINTPFKHREEYL